jgi:uncharacterized protein YndB with AHSA1/START domain
MLTSRSAIDPVHDEVLVKSATVPLSTVACFRLFSESRGVESWLCKKANIESRIGGAYELFWEPREPEIDRTISCRVTACEVGRLLAFQ